MLRLCFMFCFFSSYTHSSIINYSRIRVITTNETNTYFGYSILLQKGNPPLAIVGAPKTKRQNKNIGSVFKCDLRSFTCSEYKYISVDGGQYHVNKNGDFLGSALVGDDTTGGQFFTCSPRFVTLDGVDNHFIKGRCYKVPNSNYTNTRTQMFNSLSSRRLIGLVKGQAFYDSAFGQFGMAISYSKGENELIVGAPGTVLWNGILVRLQLKYGQSAFLEYQPDYINYHDNYYGYSVSFGKFIQNSKKIWYVSGAPRGSKLKGNVIFFEEIRGRNLVKLHISGEQFGSYFGASLLVLHKTNGGDDILVGAPMYSGSSWDEGCVYYYKNKNNGNFDSPLKLCGKQSGGKFGSTMADMGDMDLDTFRDCAISAPYEDDGTGAVYLYFGTRDGFSTTYFHRISPSKFVTVLPTSTIKGFGMGLSKGVDIDNNGHNDLVIGAYQSGQIFTITTSNVIDITPTIVANVAILYTTTTNFSITYCLKYNYRNNKNTAEMPFQIQLLHSDDRISNQRNITEIFTLKPNIERCKAKLMLLKHNFLKLNPVGVYFKYKINDELESFSETSLEIPVSFGCGSDNVCQTDLSLTVQPVNITNIIIGLVNEFKINVNVTNRGEKAYQTKLIITVPPELNLINLRECNLENGSYICVTPQLSTNEIIEKSFLFDTTDIQLYRDELPIAFKVESFGNETNPKDNTFHLKIPVKLQSNPYLDSESFPDKVVYNKTEAALVVNHRFRVSNLGPSPLNLTVVISVPQIQLNGSRVLEIDGVEEASEGIKSECIYLDKYRYKNNPDMMMEANKSILLFTCSNSAINCTHILCKKGFLSKSSESILFSLKVTVHTDRLVPLIGKNKNKVHFTSVAHFSNKTHDFFANSTTVILYNIPDGTSLIPFWIYLAIACGSGIILLAIVIFILYKCNFFKRTYKEMMETESTEQCTEMIIQEEDIDLNN